MAFLLDFDTDASMAGGATREILGNPWNDVQRSLDAIVEGDFLWFMWLGGGQEDVLCVFEV